MSKSMLHLNSNILCAVDIQTTGNDPEKHDIWQICILPLDSYMKPSKVFMPFYTTLKPENPEEHDPKYVTRSELASSILSGINAYKATEILDDWFKKLKLPEGKLICPISHSWVWTSAFIHRWLGSYQYHTTFHEWYRDLLPVSLYLNDCADLNIEQIPYPKNTLGFLCARLNVINDKPHDALEDCKAMAECYHTILKRLF